jgi:hypothetical protein
LTSPGAQLCIPVMASVSFPHEGRPGGEVLGIQPPGLRWRHAWALLRYGLPLRRILQNSLPGSYVSAV